jgi:hypothetical protein
MVKYRRSLETVVLFWLLFFVLLGASILVAHNWSLLDFLITFCIFEVFSLLILPLCGQTVKFDGEKISLCFWFITFQTFEWADVRETGIAYTRAGYGTYKKMIYISKRPVTEEERFDILHVKDNKNFITMENRGNIVEEIEEYSALPFQPLPNKESFHHTDNKPAAKKIKNLYLICVIDTMLVALFIGLRSMHGSYPITRILLPVIAGLLLVDFPVIDLIRICREQHRFAWNDKQARNDMLMIVIIIVLCGWLFLFVRK